MGKIVSPAFFNKPTLKAAEGLLGCLLCRRVGRRVVRLLITEVEAYDGPEDRASHARRGKTPRNAPMFGEAGHFYLYFTYGMHWMLNIVTSPTGYPAAVLIRGGILVKDSPLHRKGESFAVRSRGAKEVNGPARLTKFLRIDKRFNNKKVSRKTGLWIEKGRPISPSQILRTPRIGVGYAGEWAKKPYRFVLRE